ncbi:hypothetical protein CCAX7_44080 [Capsulimonas corticalis]|uniref:Uncharacterized protein n=1 Tax=Capsulimonas corticalis TaxID=2219043 RepID=A0A402CXA6_9BACT|nr:hypothetical protein [Capsulimonas corticalis]BDI32357.1 hypothetical protein CCAX7_44080 [Capsulimonas corticalis]
MKKRQSISCLLFTAMSIGLGSTAFAASSLNINSERGAVAAREVGAQYGVDIRLSGIRRQLVTFSVVNADGPGARLDAVNTLANALGATFTKIYVVTKSEGDAPQHALIDSTARVPFSKTSLSAGDAIARIADADDAVAQVAGDIQGSVTLSAPGLTIAQAMNEIAAQTHTSWKTMYVLTPRGSQLAADQRIVGHTASGSPILQMSKIFYDNPARDAMLAREAEDARKKAEQEQQAMLAAQKQASAQTGANGAAANAANATGAQGGNANYPNAPYPYSYPSAYNNGSGLIVLGASNYPNNAAAYYGATSNGR